VEVDTIQVFTEELFYHFGCNVPSYSMHVQPVEYDDFVTLEILDDEMKLTVNMTNI
jgi:hypothetical protein